MNNNLVIRWPVNAPDCGWVCHPHDHAFISAMKLKILAPFQDYIQQAYEKEFHRNDRRDANLLLLDAIDIDDHVTMRPLLDDDSIRMQATRRARACLWIGNTQDNAENILRDFDYYANKIGISPPQTDTIDGAIARYQCTDWWTRQLRKVHGQAVEKVALSLNIINKRREIYASDDAVKRIRAQKIRNYNILKGLIAVNEDGYECSLQELQEHSLANPSNRRDELMVRIFGFEAIAQESGHIGEFYTPNPCIEIDFHLICL